MNRQNLKQTTKPQPQQLSPTHGANITALPTRQHLETTGLRRGRGMVRRRGLSVAKKICLGRIHHGHLQRGSGTTP